MSVLVGVHRGGVRSLFSSSACARASVVPTRCIPYPPQLLMYGTTPRGEAARVPTGDLLSQVMRAAVAAECATLLCVVVLLLSRWCAPVPGGALPFSPVFHSVRGRRPSRALTAACSPPAARTPRPRAATAPFTGGVRVRVRLGFFFSPKRSFGKYNYYFQR